MFNHKSWQVLGFSLLVLAFFLAFGPSAQAASPSPIPPAGINLSGYGWSSNIGWINFGGYAANAGSGVKLNSDGAISGYAWSPHVGWLNFNNPLGAGTSPRVLLPMDKTGSASGWAKFPTADKPEAGGWDGKLRLGTQIWPNDVALTISPSPVSSSTKLYKLNGYAWGGDVVGWVSLQAGSQTRADGCTGVCGSSLFPTVDLKVTVPGVVRNSDGPISVNSGRLAVLSWSSTNASSCTASNGWSGVKGLSGGEWTPAITSSKIYVITCTDAAGATATDSVRVDVSGGEPAAPTVDLKVNNEDSASIDSGASANLSWTTTNATTCTASRTPTQVNNWNSSKSTGTGSQSTGTLNVNSDTTYTYTLTCSGAGGSTSDSVTISVNDDGDPPGTEQPTVDLLVNNQPSNDVILTTVDPVTNSVSANLSWTTTHANSCITDGGQWGRGTTKSTSSSGESTGNLPVSVTPYSYTLRCDGPGGTTSDTVTITVRSFCGVNPADPRCTTVTPTIELSGTKVRISNQPGGGAAAIRPNISPRQVLKLTAKDGNINNVKVSNIYVYGTNTRVSNRIRDTYFTCLFVNPNEQAIVVPTTYLASDPGCHGSGNVNLVQDQPQGFTIAVSQPRREIANYSTSYDIAFSGVTADGNPIDEVRVKFEYFVPDYQLY